MMNKKILALVLAVVVLLGAVLALGMFRDGREPSGLWVLCTSSAADAAEGFREFARTGEETAWWSAVVEFRSFMKAYHLLKGEADTEYLWCNSVYGFLLYEPEWAGRQAEALAQAMERLARDPEDVNGFSAISRVNNALLHGE